MMDYGKRKPLAVIAIGVKPKGGDEDGGDGEEMATRDFMAALKEGDVKAASSALKDFVRICLAKAKAGAYEESE